MANERRATTRAKKKTPAELPEGFTAEERAAMQERAKELKASRRGHLVPPASREP